MAGIYAILYVTTALHDSARAALAEVDSALDSAERRCYQ